jgi:hypothetical protein
MVIIRASRCIYVLPYDEYCKHWKPFIHKLFNGKKNVIFEYKGQKFAHCESDFNLNILPKVEWGLRLEALKRGKGFMRTEKSYAAKGSGKHASFKV